LVGQLLFCAFIRCEDFFFDAEFTITNALLISRCILSFAAALIYSEVPAADQSGGQTKSCIEFTVKETNEKVVSDLSLCRSASWLATEIKYSSCAV